jgi:hypothetical protein
MIFRVNNKLIEINKHSFNTDKEFYESIMNIMGKITNVATIHHDVYTSTKISELLKQNSTNHKD